MSEEAVGSLHRNQFIILSIRHRVYAKGNAICDQMKMNEISKIYNPNTPGDF